MITTNKIKDIQKRKNLSLRQLSRILDYGHGGLSNIINAKTPFPEPLINKILPILEVSRKEFDSWVIADKYSKEVLELAIKNKKDFPYKRKSILTYKIDEILKEKNISRTIFAKQINYDQSALNKMITGKINMSKPVIEKISQALEIPQKEITSWVAANKYSLELLELALNLHIENESLMRFVQSGIKNSWKYEKD